MRSILSTFILLLIFFVVGCGGDSGNEKTANGDVGGISTNKDWNELSQTERNQRIIDEALGDFRKNVGVSCKVWVQNVVRNASDGNVGIPLNNEDGSGWRTDPNGTTFGDGKVALFRQNQNPILLNISPGAIIQIKWKEGFASDDPKYNIHTAIILHVLEDIGAIFIESNYDTPKNEADASVGIRFVSEKEFEKQVEAYSIYYVVK